MQDLQNRLQELIGEAYRIEGELGGGGMSRVFIAEEVELGRRVVIKVLPPEMAAGVNQERFRREIQLAASLQHPHIVPLLTAGSAGDLLYYVMPYIEGESLRAKLGREGELPVGEALRILCEVVDALAYAHQQGVIHRDIKPENVLLSRNHAVVADFGVAKAVTASAGESSLTSLGMALGTPAYMAPEQAAADPHTDHRADVYAVGAVAYEMLTGRPVFTASSPQMVMAAHLSEVPDPITKHRPSVSESLNSVVMRCLEKRAADRWQSADELKPLLDAMATPTGGITPTGGTAPVAALNADALRKRSHPARVAGIYGVSSVAVLAVAYSLMMLLGLPDWVLPGAVALLVIGFPIVMLTGRVERKRAIANATGVSRSAPDQGIHGWLDWRKAILGGAVAFGALTVAVAAYMAMRLLGIGPVGTLVAAGVLEERERIILAAFEDRTADSTLGQTVTELFRIDFAQSPAVTVLEPSQIAPVLERMERDPGTLLTPELANEVAQREGIKAVLTGEILPVGNGYVVSARLVTAATGDVLAADRQTADNSDAIIAAVDRLSANLRERIGESLRTIRANEPLEGVTTSSMVALGKYSQALRADNLDDSERAIALLEEAVAEDTAFAMAYRKLGIILNNTGADGDRADEALTKAFEHRDRLTEREGYIAAGSYYWAVADDRQAAITAYRSVLEKWPSDIVALNNLGLAYGDTRRWADAEDLYLRSIAAGSAPAVTHGNVVSVQVAQGKYEEAAASLELFSQAYPGHPNVEATRGALAASRTDYQAAEEQIRALREAQRGNLRWRANTGFNLSNLAEIRGRLGEAARYWTDATAALYERGVMNIPRELFEALAWANSDIWYGRDTDRAVGRIERALGRQPLEDLPPDDRPYLWLSDTYARAGMPDQSRRWLAERDGAIDEKTRREQREGERFTLGLIALAEGRPNDALTEFRAVEQESSCPICQSFEIGVAYDSLGLTDSTIAEYEHHLNTPFLFRLGLDSDERPAVYRRLGELYEERGDTERAAEYYGRFVELWAEADPELQPVVQDVRNRLARLAGEPRGR